MPVNDLISVADYNDIRNLINPVIGVGSGNFGYGQTSYGAAVTANDRVTKTQWDGLRYDIINAIAHQTGSPPVISEATANDLIRYDANLPNFQYLTLANQANTNRLNIGAGRFATEPSYNVDSFVTFYGEAVVTLSATWNSGNDARHFFNSGGRINFSSSFTPFKSTNQNNNWQTLLSTAGTKFFDGNSGVNFYSLTSTDQKFAEQRGTGTYSANYWRLFAKCNVANNSTGTANQITFTIRWLDGYSENSSTNNNQPPREGVSGNLTLTVTQRRAFAALYPELIAGSFQGPRPTWSSSGVAVTNAGERPLGPALAPDPGSVNSFVYPSRITSYVITSVLPKSTTGFFTIEHEGTANANFNLVINTAPAGAVITTNPSIGSTITLAPNTSQYVTYTITSPLGSYPDTEFTYVIEVQDANGLTYNAKHTHTQIRVLTEEQIPESYYLTPPSGSPPVPTPPPPPPPPPPSPTPSPTPSPPPITYNEVITVPSSVSAGQIFSGSITGGQPFSSFTLTWRNSSGTIVSGPGTSTLDSNGNYTSGAIGSLSPAGTYTVTVVFAASGNVRSRTVTVT